MARLLNVRVHARSRRRSVEEKTDGSLVIHTTAAPENGKANEDVVDILSTHLGIAKSLIILVRGATSSKKVFKIMA